MGSFLIVSCAGRGHPFVPAVPLYSVGARGLLVPQGLLMLIACSVSKGVI